MKRNIRSGECKICGSFQKNILRHYSMVHKIPLKESLEYIGIYPNKCLVCGKETQYRNGHYLQTCGNPICTANFPGRKEKEKQTRLKNNPDDPYRIKKRKKTNLIKYGNENYANRDQMVKTWNSKSPEEKYEREIKREKTCFKKYGTKLASQNDVIKKKTLESVKIYWKKKENIENPYQSEEVKKKIKKTCIDKFGVDNIFKSKEFITMVRLKRRIRTWNALKRFDNKIILLNSKEEFINGLNNYKCIYKWKCVTCGNEFESYIGNGKFPRCYKCYPPFESKPQKELTSFINDICELLIIINDRKTIKNVMTGRGLELDIYIPDMKLAFEFNGVFWHKNDEFKHINKTMLCQEQGIRLIHVWEDDWINKQDIIKSRIKNMFGLSEKIMARKCHITKINNEDARLFLNENHLQGSINAKYSYGLYYQGELVAVATFGKNRFKGNETELYRYCSKLGTNVMGGLSKLCKHFMKENHVNEIISYCSRDWGDGHGYLSAGFVQVGITSPNYWYVGPDNDWIRESRHKYQKHKLLKMWPDIDPSLTEHEIMATKGFVSIYDAGNIKYQLSN